MTARRANGFTLLEVLVAMALVGIAVAALMSGIAGSLRNLDRAAAHERGLLLARSQMNRLLVEQRLEPGRLQGTLDGGYRWAADVRQWNPAGAAQALFDPRLPPLMLVRLTLSWGNQQLTLESCKLETPR